MSELVFTFFDEPWEIALHLTTSFTRELGEETVSGWVPLDLTGSTFEMVFGTDRHAEGAPTLILDTANGDLVPGAGGALTFLFRGETRLTALEAKKTYAVDINRIQGGVKSPFARGRVSTYQGPKA